MGHPERNKCDSQIKQSKEDQREHQGLWVENPRARLPSPLQYLRSSMSNSILSDISQFNNKFRDTNFLQFIMIIKVHRISHELNVISITTYHIILVVVNKIVELFVLLSIALLNLVLCIGNCMHQLGHIDRNV